MSAKNLTEAAVAAIKPVEKRQVDYPDNKVSGLALRVSPGGTKTWVFRYLAPTGQRRRMKLGTYPALKLADARSRALKIRGATEDDRDPAIEREERRRLSASLDTLAEEYWKAAANGLHGGRQRAKRPSTIALERQRYEAHAKPEIGSRPFNRLERGDIRALQRTLTEKGLSAHTVAGVIGAVRSILGLAVFEERILANPATRIVRADALPSRERLWTGAQARKLYRHFTLKECKLEPSMKLLLRFIAVTLARKDEARLATWAEIDLGAKVWTVPSDRMKSGRPHVVPLSTEALEILGAAKAHTRGKGFVFPSLFLRPGEKRPRPLNKDAPYVAIRRACERLKIPAGGLHDWRRTGATILTGEELGARRFVVSLLLAHNATEGAAVTGVYDRNTYLPERRRALEAWGQYVSNGVAERPETP
jgi:integrase